MSSCHMQSAGHVTGTLHVSVIPGSPGKYCRARRRGEPRVRPELRVHPTRTGRKPVNTRGRVPTCLPAYLMLPTVMPPMNAF